jgi:hypothetical protein
MNEHLRDGAEQGHRKVLADKTLYRAPKTLHPKVQGKNYLEILELKKRDWIETLLQPRHSKKLEQP